jgi:prepilin-type N-terminal cleavage/methylation domain-containing protein
MSDTHEIKGPLAMRRESQGGFTLVELLIVIVILAILAAIVVFAVGTTSQNAVAASCSADAKSVETAMSAYDAQLASYPANLAALATTQVGPNGTVGPWLRAIPSTTHYNVTNVGSNLFVLPPTQAGPLYTVGNITASAIAGGTFDFDANPSICGQYS